MFKADPKRHPSCSHLMLLPRAASLAPLGVFSTPPVGGLGPGPPLVFCFLFFNTPARPPPRGGSAPHSPRDQNATAQKRVQSSLLVCCLMSVVSSLQSGPRVWVYKVGHIVDAHLTTARLYLVYLAGDMATPTVKGQKKRPRPQTLRRRPRTCHDLGQASHSL